MSNHIIMLLEMLSDLADIDDVLFITKSNGATSEVRSNSLETVRQNQRWITIGNNDGPAHMHIDSELVCSARFVQEAKPDRTSYSVRFFDQKGDRVFAAFFTKMYDDSRRLILRGWMSTRGCRRDTLLSVQVVMITATMMVMLMAMTY